ncbi:hypothetical protein FVA81_00820 (plasmid) [Rhizobium sp. WL3]|uniref:hypothetical protein n=1 Tax=Rhizobium sp. WL3 TaxID=2603277 RepID=UPI0011C1EDC8|nr:hypothetical protein [Rhizobium sp. WL3]QEE43228.1 hypothetical protein FVA81_00820 [Rhizobium sp. WL3]
MASPWKFLSRLVSPRRQKGPGDEQADDVNPDEPGIASSATLLDSGRLDPVEPPGAKSSLALDPTNGPAAPHGAPGQAVGHPQDTVATDGSKVDDVSRPRFPDTAVIPAYGASNVEDASEAVPAKRKRRSRTVEPIVTASKAPPVVVAASDDETSLDDEIRALRGQLVRKLRLQNAQLKKMLERFEP